MSETQTFILAHDEARRRAIECVKTAPEGHAVRVGPSTRTLDQNALLWTLLHEIAANVDWYGNKLSAGEWKDVFTAALKKEKVVPGLNGGFVVLGQHTSKMNKKDFSELLELIMAFAAEHGVKLP